MSPVFAFIFAIGSFSIAHAAAMVSDSKVTAVGRAAARAREVLNWALTIDNAGFAKGSTAIYEVFKKIRTINSITIAVIIIIIAFGMILRASWAEGQRRTLVNLLIAFCLSWFTFTIASVAIQQVDGLQTKLMRITEKSTGVTRHIQAEDLLSVSFNYQNFKGFKSSDPNLQESVDNTLTLVKLTTWTNYAIAAVIVIRIVILWLLVIFSPLMLSFAVFAPTKNIAGFWLREFARWIFIGPIFAIFLAAVPYIWQQTNLTPGFLPSGTTRNSGIPLQTNSSLNGEKPQNIYESGTNITLAPPGVTGSKLQVDATAGTGNSLSETDTYARYIVALIMLWLTILLPFIFTRTIIALGKQAASALANYQVKDYIKTLGGKGRGPAANTQGGTATSDINDKALKNAEAIVKPTRVSTTNVPSTIGEPTGGNISKNMPVEVLANAAGLSSSIAGELIKHQESTSQAAPISTLAKAEIADQGGTGSITDTLSKVRDSESLDKPQADKIGAVKNALFVKQMEGSRAAKSISNAISYNTSSLVSQNVTGQILERNIKALGETDATKATQPIADRAKANDENATRAMPIVTKYLDIQKQASGPLKDVMADNQKVTAISEFSQKAADALKMENLSSSNDPQAKIQLGEIEAKFKDPQEAQSWQAFARELQLEKKSGNKDAKEVIDSTENITQAKKNKPGEIADKIINKDGIDDITADKESQLQYAQTKQTWLDYYQKGEIPKSAGTSDRRTWLQKETGTLEGILKDLSDDKTRDRAVKKLEKVVPYALLGGVELTDLIIYVKAKLEAVKEAFTRLFGPDDEAKSRGVK